MAKAFDDEQILAAGKPARAHTCAHTCACTPASTQAHVHAHARSRLRAHAHMQASRRSRVDCWTALWQSVRGAACAKLGTAAGTSHTGAIRSPRRTRHFLVHGHPSWSNASSMLMGCDKVYRVDIQRLLTDHPLLFEVPLSLASSPFLPSTFYQPPIDEENRLRARTPSPRFRESPLPRL